MKCDLCLKDKVDAVFRLEWDSHLCNKCYAEALSIVEEDEKIKRRRDRAMCSRNVFGGRTNRLDDRGGDYR